MHAARVQVWSFLVASSLLGVGCAVDGKAGAPGANGHNTLVNVTLEPRGANCTLGGQRIDSGLDSNGNGVLDASEIQQTTYICETAWPAGAGIQENLSLTDLRAQGWITCYQDAYSNTGTTIASILAGCQGTYMMLACRADNVTDTITVAAADTRTVVTTPDATGTTTFHAANGVGWYFTDTQSWGFFPANDTLNRSSCDIPGVGGVASEDADKRLCWHASAGVINGGFRCGATQFLNSNATWQRLVLVW